jgi:hypothetical protein
LGSNAAFNANGETNVMWQWRANGSGSTNTAGSITSTVSANTSAGFSVVTFTGNGSAATVGHGLGVAPKMYILRKLSGLDDWVVYNSNLTDSSYYLVLNSTNAEASNSVVFNSTAPTSTVFSVGSSRSQNGQPYIAYCFAQIAGYSAFGKYTGNGSTDGPFVFTGFRPKYIMFKNSSGASGWPIFDSARDPSNVANDYLNANWSDAEYNDRSIDILSNGFKIREASSTTNASGGTIIYMAFAENPFKYSLAR